MCVLTLDILLLITGMEMVFAMLIKGHTGSNGIFQCLILQYITAAGDIVGRDWSASCTVCN